MISPVLAEIQNSGFQVDIPWELKTVHKPVIILRQQIFFKMSLISLLLAECSKDTPTCPLSVVLQHNFNTFNSPKHTLLVPFGRGCMHKYDKGWRCQSTLQFSHGLRASGFNCPFSGNGYLRYEAIFIADGSFMKVNILSHFSHPLIFAKLIDNIISFLHPCEIRCHGDHRSVRNGSVLLKKGLITRFNKSSHISSILLIILEGVVVDFHDTRCSCFSFKFMTVKSFRTINLTSGTVIYEALFSHPKLLKSLSYDVMSICKTVAGSSVPDCSSSVCLCLFSSSARKHLWSLCHATVWWWNCRMEALVCGVSMILMALWPPTSARPMSTTVTFTWAPSALLTCVSWTWAKCSPVLQEHGTVGHRHFLRLLYQSCNISSRSYRPFLYPLP